MSNKHNFFTSSNNINYFYPNEGIPFEWIKWCSQLFCINIIWNLVKKEIFTQNWFFWWLKITYRFLKIVKKDRERFDATKKFKLFFNYMIINICYWYWQKTILAKILNKFKHFKVIIFSENERNNSTHVKKIMDWYDRIKTFRRLSSKPTRKEWMCYNLKICIFQYQSCD